MPKEPVAVEIEGERPAPEAPPGETLPQGSAAGRTSAAGATPASAPDPARETVPQSFWKGFDVNPAAQTTPRQVSKAKDE